MPARDQVYGTMLVIVLNVVIIATTHCVPVAPLLGIGQGACVAPPAWAALWSASNYVFSVFYLVEMILKMIAYGRHYFSDGWNVFDFLLVLGSVVDVALEVMQASSDTQLDLVIQPSSLRVLRLFRISRLLRIIRHTGKLRVLLITFITSLPSLVNVGALLLLLLFVYAVLGVALFSAVPYGAWITRHANFQTLGTALLTLFRAVTGESWNGFMHECMVHSGTAVGVVYFLSFTTVAGFILLNLIIAIILENFTSTAEEREIPEDAFLHYREQWEKLDPDATGNIPSSELLLLLRRTRQPLGFAEGHGAEKAEALNRGEQLKVLKEMNIDDHGGKVNFQLLLQALTQHAHKAGKYGKSPKANIVADGVLQQQIKKQMKQALAKAHAFDLTAPSCNQAELQAALALQTRFRDKRGRQDTRMRRRRTPSEVFQRTVEIAMRRRASVERGAQAAAEASIAAKAEAAAKAKAAAGAGALASPSAGAPASPSAGAPASPSAVAPAASNTAAATTTTTTDEGSRLGIPVSPSGSSHTSEWSAASAGGGRPEERQAPQQPHASELQRGGKAGGLRHKKRNVLRKKGASAAPSEQVRV
jgi:hypothetical protein